ncbi:MAG: DinB family protein [Phycisphaeraceae bacterium]
MGNTPIADQIHTPLICLLEELAGVLRSLSDEQYTHRFGEVFDSSIGGHVRHVLDHVAAWLDATADGELNYDRRQRGTDVETHRQIAVDHCEQLIDRLNQSPADGERTLTLHVLLSADAPPITTTTTVAREAAFVVGHTVHHNAIISVMARMRGGQLPAKFGYAPSTLAFLRTRGR